MGRICIVLLAVAFVCLAYGFKADVNDIDNEINDAKVPYMTEEQPMDTENALEEPEGSDVDGDFNFKDDEEQEEQEEPSEDEDEEDDAEKAANEQRVEDEFEAQLSRMEAVERKRLGNQEGEAERSLSTKSTGGKSLGWWNRHTYRRTVIHKHHYHKRYVYKYSLKCKSGTWVGGHIHSGKPIYKTIRFKPYFRSTPAVVTGVQYLNSHSHYHNVRFRVQVIAKSRTYMRIKLWTWGYHNGVHNIYVNWMACPQ